MQPDHRRIATTKFRVLYRNNSNKVIYKAQLSKGGITGTVVDIRIIFKIAFEQNATAIILSAQPSVRKIDGK